MSDIQDLFQKDPEHLTRDDLREMAAYYRDKRAQFNLGDMQAGNAKKLKKNGTPQPKITNVEDLLSDLL